MLDEITLALWERVRGAYGLEDPPAVAELQKGGEAFPASISTDRPAEAEMRGGIVDPAAWEAEAERREHGCRSAAAALQIAAVENRDLSDTELRRRGAPWHRRVDHFVFRVVNRVVLHWFRRRMELYGNDLDDPDD